MGDRGNIRIDYGQSDKHVYFYSHWRGNSLFKLLKESLSRGRNRWHDEAYLARIIFCDMMEHEERELTGFGIAPYMGDNEYDLFAVNSKLGMIYQLSKNDETTVNEWAFDDFIILEKDPRLSTE
jgi:hypothetical protein